LEPFLLPSLPKGASRSPQRADTEPQEQVGESQGAPVKTDMRDVVDSETWEEERQTEIPWMTLYLSAAVWCSIALTHAPVIVPKPAFESPLPAGILAS
jgi:hypothetical protein